jgi:hypothetical protein
MRGLHLDGLKYDKHIMKKLILILAVALSGCAVIFPKPHDPVMFGQAVEVKVGLSKISCADKSNWQPVLDKVELVKVYSTERNDPQSDAFGKMEEALNKAKASNSKVFCESIVKLNRTRVDVALDAWKGR